MVTVDFEVLLGQQTGYVPQSSLWRECIDSARLRNIVQLHHMSVVDAVNTALDSDMLMGTFDLYERHDGLRLHTTSFLNQEDVEFLYNYLLDIKIVMFSRVLMYVVRNLGDNYVVYLNNTDYIGGFDICRIKTLLASRK